MSEKVRRRFHDLPHRTGPVQAMRAAGVILLALIVALAIMCVFRGRIATAIALLAIGLAVGAVVLSQTQFIRDRKAGRP